MLISVIEAVWSPCSKTNSLQSLPLLEYLQPLKIYGFNQYVDYKK